MIINNLPWTLEAEARLDGHHMYQTCMSSGKTTLAGRWAVDQTLLGRDVVWLVDSVHRVAPFVRAIENALQQKDINPDVINWNNSNRYHINGQTIQMIRTLGNGRGYRFQSLVVDDADTMAANDWGGKRYLYNFMEQIENSLILGSGKIKGLMKQFNDDLPIYRNYHSIDYKRAMRDGILSQGTLNDYMSWFKPETFDNMMGPWITGNSANAHLLSRYDA